MDAIKIGMDVGRWPPGRPDARLLHQLGFDADKISPYFESRRTPTAPLHPTHDHRHAATLPALAERERGLNP